MRVAISGTRGRIGSALRENLSFEIVRLDRPEFDMMDKGSFVDAIKGCDALIHLAWNTIAGDSILEDNPNLQMVRNVCEAAIESGVKRVIIASSVHVNYLPDFYGKSELKVDSETNPSGAYGRLKVEIEDLAKSYFSLDLQVTVIRFGGVFEDNKPDDAIERAVWLSKRDCASLIEKIVLSDIKGFVLMYAVSDNKKRFHSLENPFLWVPQDSM